MGESLFGREAFFSGLEEAKDQVFDKITVFVPSGGKRDFSFYYIGNCLRVVDRFKGSASGNHPIESYACGPKVNALVVSSTRQNFRGKILGGTYDGKHVSALPS